MADGGRSLLRLLRLVRIVSDHENTVNVVRHDQERIEVEVRNMAWQCSPRGTDDRADRV